MKKEKTGVGWGDQSYIFLIGSLMNDVMIDIGGKQKKKGKLIKKTVRSFNFKKKKKKKKKKNKKIAMPYLNSTHTNKLSKLFEDQEGYDSVRS